MLNSRKYLDWVIVSGLVLLDQALKYVAILKFGSLVSYNGGGAFGVGHRYIFYEIITLVMTVFIVGIYFFISEADRRVKLPIVLIMSGAISNQLDRFFRHGVVDYIDFKIWPSFNLADSLIFIGVCLIAYRVLIRKRAI